MSFNTLTSYILCLLAAAMVASFYWAHGRTIASIFATCYRKARSFYYSFYEKRAHAQQEVRKAQRQWIAIKREKEKLFNHCDKSQCHVEYLDAEYKALMYFIALKGKAEDTELYRLRLLRRTLDQVKNA